MYKEEKKKLEDQMKSKGYSYSPSDGKWRNGNDCFKFEGSNRLNNNGTTTYGYSNSKDRVEKK